MRIRIASALLVGFIAAHAQSAQANATLQLLYTVDWTKLPGWVAAPPAGYTASVSSQIVGGRRLAMALIYVERTYQTATTPPPAMTLSIFSGAGAAVYTGALPAQVTAAECNFTAYQRCPFIGSGGVFVTPIAGNATHFYVRISKSPVGSTGAPTNFDYILDTAMKKWTALPAGGELAQDPGYATPVTYYVNDSVTKTTKVYLPSFP